MSTEVIRSARLENYSFVDAEDLTRIIDPVSHEGSFRIIGNAYREDFDPGDFIVTSIITEYSLSENTALSESGTLYTLVKKSPDYEEYLQCLNCGIPVIYHWNYLGHTHSGYYIRFYDAAGNEKFLDIIKQVGNYLILDDGKNYFINWLNGVSCSISPKQNVGYMNLEKPIVYSEFCGVLCRPKINVG